MVNVAILGYGTVGSGVFEVINKNNSHISRRAGDDVNVKYVLDLRDFPGDPVESVLVHDFNVILNDPEVDVVVEVMGGVEPAHTFVRQSLEQGKSVCTSNKEMVAKYGAELLKVAKEHTCNFLYEASVGGGIPIIRPLNQSLTVDHVNEISGILNGTTNYILTKMSEEGLKFEDVLKDAQDRGYAERNPEADVEGYDACRKIAILASMAYEKQVDYEDIYTEGITKITKEDFEYVSQLGASIKLLGKAWKESGNIYAMVAPFVINKDNPLYGVRGVFNAILLNGDMLGDVMFYGKGAGKLATASAVVSDVVDAIKHKGKIIMTFWGSEKRTLGDINDFAMPYFVRVEGAGKEAEIEKVLDNVQFISAPADSKVAGTETAFITEAVKGADLEEALKGFTVVSKIRVSQ